MTTSEKDIVSMFMQYIEAEDTEAMQRVIDTRIDMKDLFGEGTTALHIAILNKKNISRDFMVAAGLDVNAKGFLNISPLRLALEANDIESVECLLNAGAYPFAESAHDTRDGTRMITDLEFSERSHAPMEIGVIVRSASERYALVREASISRFANVEDFIQREHSVNAADDKGNTPLHYAAMCQNQNVVGRLVAAKADVNLENKKGYTALIACYMDCENPPISFDCFDELIKGGARVLAPTSKGPSLYSILRAEGTRAESLLRHLRPHIDKEMAEMSHAASTVQQKTKLMPRIQTIRKNAP